MDAEKEEEGKTPHISSLQNIHEWNETLSADPDSQEPHPCLNVQFERSQTNQNPTLLSKHRLW